jgi:hypothetical protein
VDLTLSVLPEVNSRKFKVRKGIAAEKGIVVAFTEASFRLNL